MALLQSPEELLDGSLSFFAVHSHHSTAATSAPPPKAATIHATILVQPFALCFTSYAICHLCSVREKVDGQKKTFGILASENRSAKVSEGEASKDSLQLEKNNRDLCL